MTSHVVSAADLSLSPNDGRAGNDKEKDSVEKVNWGQGGWDVLPGVHNSSAACWSAANYDHHLVMVANIDFYGFLLIISGVWLWTHCCCSDW